MNNLASLLILAFLAITFLQSGYDKFTDYQGNLNWLKDHFKNTIFDGKVSISLNILLAFEIIAGILCIVGGIELLVNEGTTFGKYGAAVSCVTLLMLLFGQRIAKDYDGARTIAIYFIIAVLGLYLLQ
ncbi:DoxX family protein [Flavobacterium oreochromis]|uniref:DoxX family protein n=2 Tax=Flavobacterium TaxID=237 RepID=A0A246G8E9_9FLAO|nr:DoxX family protein [Flavobacterium oreochromis]OWP74247.1 DoxX family protein [Flavobacterium oreochromis]OWP75177.1 DoxX family protein [Flavobacterium oreochromis]POR18121.1 DoxX family protein [Flavobacterium columnare]QYS87312.1 DoxX family protein [Flavobacterium oreochromis]